MQINENTKKFHYEEIIFSTFLLCTFHIFICHFSDLNLILPNSTPSKMLDLILQNTLHYDQIDHAYDNNYEQNMKLQDCMIKV